MLRKYKGVFIMRTYIKPKQYQGKLMILLIAVLLTGCGQKSARVTSAPPESTPGWNNYKLNTETELTDPEDEDKTSEDAEQKAAKLKTLLEAPTVYADYDSKDFEELSPGWYERPEGWYYFDEDLRMLTGWQSINGEVYCLADDGLMLSDIVIDDFYLSKDGKIEMIKCFKEHGINSPWYFVIDKNYNEISKKITFPCIFKPADNSASRGVCLVQQESEIEKAYEYSKSFSRNGRVLVEEYMQGPEVSVEVLIWKNNPHVIAVTDKITTGAPYFVEMGHNEPSSLSDEDIVKIKNLAASAVKAVGIDNGQGHVEIILTKEGPKVVELGARLGGDFITSDLVPLSTGVDMLKETLSIACGEEPNLNIKFSKGSAIRFINVDIGTILDIKGIDRARSIPGVKRIEFFKEVGDQSVEVHNSLDRVGCLIAQSNTAKEAADLCTRAIKEIEVLVK